MIERHWGGPPPTLGPARPAGDSRNAWVPTKECYSYLRISAGSNAAALIAGSVPKITPTSDDTAMPTAADNPETGMRYSVVHRTANGIPNPTRIPISPPPTEIA